MKESHCWDSMDQRDFVAGNWEVGGASSFGCGCFGFISAKSALAAFLFLFHLRRFCLFLLLVGHGRERGSGVLGCFVLNSVSILLGVAVGLLEPKVFSVHLNEKVCLPCLLHP